MTHHYSHAGASYSGSRGDVDRKSMLVLWECRVVCVALRGLVKLAIGIPVDVQCSRLGAFKGCVCSYGELGLSAAAVDGEGASELIINTSRTFLAPNAFAVSR